MFVRTLTEDPNTNCFTCGRWYFHVALDRCPRCGSDSVEVYTILELGLLSRAGDKRSGGTTVDRPRDKGNRAA